MVGVALGPNEEICQNGKQEMGLLGSGKLLSSSLSLPPSLFLSPLSFLWRYGHRKGETESGNSCGDEVPRREGGFQGTGACRQGRGPVPWKRAGGGVRGRCAEGRGKLASELSFFKVISSEGKGEEEGFVRTQEADVRRRGSCWRETRGATEGGEGGGAQRVGGSGGQAGHGPGPGKEVGEASERGTSRKGVTSVCWGHSGVRPRHRPGHQNE